jgi:hypothetical protein
MDTDDRVASNPGYLALLHGQRLSIGYWLMP